ncbi:MAG: gamma-glutamyltransferase [Woeseiaceae bacterium]|nr:gamma-glutamyltransferase [Woeseiaceae bacterium]
MNNLRRILLIAIAALALPALTGAQVLTDKPVLYGKNWVAITGKPLAATAGAKIFMDGGNAVDATCAMLAAAATMWDTLHWGGETQALIHNPETGEVIGINAMGVAPTGATAEFFLNMGLAYPPEYGPLAATTPGTPGGLMVMLAEYGTMSLAEVLAPAIEMAEGYPIEAGTVQRINENAHEIIKWPYSKALFLSVDGGRMRGPRVGEVFRQPQLKATLEKLVAAERQALDTGSSRKDAIYAAYDRFYRGDIAEEIVRSTREQGGLFTMRDLDEWQVYIEEAVTTNYRGVDVYKLTTWTQGPVLLQTLNILENFDLAGMGYNTVRYIHTVYQAMNLAYADRDYYYGDPYFPPEEPIAGLLSKEYARERAGEIDPDRNNPHVRPGKPPGYEDDRPLLEKLLDSIVGDNAGPAGEDESFFRGTTSIQAADKDGWVVSVTPSGGWVPAVVAGETGIGLSQRMQSFVLEPDENPFNVVEPGKRPRVTLTPGMALRNGEPFLSFAVQGGDAQDQMLLQFILNVVEFGMNVQQAAEADNFLSYQMHQSFGQHKKEPGRLGVNESVDKYTRGKLSEMGYWVEIGFWGDFENTSGPINAIYFDQETGVMQGGSSTHGDDYGIAW